MTRRFHDVLGAALLAGAAFSVSLAPVAAQDARQSSMQTSKRPVAAEKKTHRLVLQVNTNEPGTMHLTLNNAANVAQYYQERGEKVEIEIVTFGPGLNMLRSDTSPVKDRIKAMAASTPAIAFRACGNTQGNMSKAENKEIPIVPEATVVKSGVVHLMELQERGWSYVRP